MVFQRGEVLKVEARLHRRWINHYRCIVIVLHSHLGDDLFCKEYVARPISQLTVVFIVLLFYSAQWRSVGANFGVYHHLPLIIELNFFLLIIAIVVDVDSWHVQMFICVVLLDSLSKALEPSITIR